MAETAMTAENKAIFLDLAKRWRNLAKETEAMKPIGDSRRFSDGTLPGNRKPPPSGQ